MTVRHIVLTCAGAYAFAACSHASTGSNNLPSCGGRGTPLSLAVAQYASTNPASDSGWRTFAANVPSDPIEYVVLPWSPGGVLGASAPFKLEPATPTAAAPFLSAPYSPLPPGRPETARGPAANAFDRWLRDLARSRE